MVDFIKRLFCDHEYTDVSGEIKVYNSFSEYPIRRERTFVCKKCLKKKKIRY